MRSGSCRSSRGCCPESTPSGEPATRDAAPPRRVSEGCGSCAKRGGATGLRLCPTGAIPPDVSAELEFRGICRFESRQNSGRRRRLLQTTAPAFLPSSIGAKQVQRRIGGLDPGVEARRERRLAQATGMPEKGWFSNRQTGPAFAPPLTREEMATTKHPENLNRGQSSPNH